MYMHAYLAMCGEPVRVPRYGDHAADWAAEDCALSLYTPVRLWTLWRWRHGDHAAERTAPVRLWTGDGDHVPPRTARAPIRYSIAVWTVDGRRPPQLPAAALSPLSLLSLTPEPL